MTAVLAGSPALEQMEPGWELELGGGRFQDNPLDSLPLLPRQVPNR